MTIPRSFPEMIVDLYKRVEELNRRVENRERTGTVTEVDAQKGLARVQLGEDDEGKPYLTAWIPWEEQRQGFIKTFFPPSVGEQVKVGSESGDMTDAIIRGGLPSTANARPHNKPNEAMIKIGEKHTILMTEGGWHHTVPGKKVEAGKIEYQKANPSGAPSSRPGVAVSDVPMS